MQAIKQTNKKELLDDLRQLNLTVAARTFILAVGDSDLFALLGITKPEVEEAFDNLKKAVEMDK